MFKKYTLLINLPLLILVLLAPLAVWGNGGMLDAEGTNAVLPPEKPDCAGDSLKIHWLQYTNLSGSDLIYLIHQPNFPQSPDRVQFVTDLATPERFDDYYGSLLRGFIKAPETGVYTFNLCGDDESVFHLSTNDDRENLQLQCFVPGYSGYDEHNKYPEQTSGQVTLEEGTYYYFEAMVKEGGGGDHLAAYWKTPNDPDDWRLIEGVHLYEDLCQPICEPSGTPCDDGDPNTENDIEDGFCNCVGTPLNPPFSCLGEGGTIRSLFFDNIPGNQISDLTDDPSYPLSPTRSEDLKDLRTSSTNFMDDYGTRMRGFLRVPVTGDYQFNVTASDRARVYLSSNETPDVNTDEICSVNWSSLYEFDDETNQTSDLITLQAGQYYSIEVVHKESTGGDYVYVFWKTPFQLDTNWHVVSGGYLHHYTCELATLPQGTPCDDGDPNTFDDMYDGNGNCGGTACIDPECSNALDYTPYDECGTSDNHSNNPNDAWESCQPMPSPNPARGPGHWIQYDFGQTYTLNSAQVWNYNAQGATGQGFQNVVIDYSLDGYNWTELGTFNWAEASGTGGYNGFLFDELNGVVARYLLITAIDNFDGGNCYGLSEISFAAVECAPAGTACNDGDPNTTNDVYDNNCNCEGGPDLENLCSVLTRDIIGTISSADYDAEETITSTGLVENLSVVNFIAGESIHLMPGFHADYGSHFRSKIVACSPTQISSATVAQEEETNPDSNNEKELEQAAARPTLPTDKPALMVYPNPTRTWTEFYFNIPEGTSVRLGVYSASGQLLTWVVNGIYMEKGHHIKEFPAHQLAGGVYYVTLYTEDEVVSDRLVIVD